MIIIIIIIVIIIIIIIIPFRVFQTSFSRWYLIGVWETASLLQDYLQYSGRS